ncbi:hypothetical protein VDG1235_4057 [Verrucomicrobiia bacterium DG1235]|nr:hypothetical protein VDG1235_4057 [Verrucomicrobiae bacterium DG1235]
MCTASWSAGHGRLSLCFNRDERKDRAAASPPDCRKIDGVRYLSPLDPVGGGTWLSVNEYGLCVFLLNNYEAQAQRTRGAIKARSRGAIPKRLAACPDRSSAVSALRDIGLEEFNPFHVGLADCDGVTVFSWNGVALAESKLERGFLTTSSCRTKEVEAYRAIRYAELNAKGRGLSSETRRLFHLETKNADPAFNPMMLRDESRTHSVAFIEVDGDKATLRYAATIDDTRTLAPASEKVLPVLK